MLTLIKDLNRFWNKVNKTDNCWLWTGASSKGGYGRFKFEGKLYSPHVISYQLHNKNYDSIKFVCHKCDVPACINPQHLFLGTRSENMKDMTTKGRFKNPVKLGVNHHKSKLTENDVKDIKNRLKQGERVCDIAILYRYTVSANTINNIKNNKIWKSIY